MDQRTTQVATVAVIIIIGLAAVWSVWTLFAPAPAYDSVNDRPMTMKVTVIGEEALPSNFMWCEVYLEDGPVDLDGYEFDGTIDAFGLTWASDTQNEGRSNLQYSVYGLDELTRGTLRVRIYTADETWELIIADLDGEPSNWAPYGEFNSGPLDGEQTWGALWRRHVAYTEDSTPYEVYFELGPRWD